MQSLEQLLAGKTAAAVKALFGKDIDPAAVTFQKTNQDFEGDITLVVFPFVKLAGKSPEETGRLLGDYLKENCPEVERFNVIKGFLNLVIGPAFWLNAFNLIAADPDHGTTAAAADSPLVMVEYSSPNTNKPLHLGHVRNNLLGLAVSNILKANGNNVMMVNLVNDRGIHICKSMLAWKKWGNGETPESTGLKGDHLVGRYYVEFDLRLKLELKPLLDRIYHNNDLSGYSEKEQTEIKAQLQKLEALKAPLKAEAGKLDPENLGNEEAIVQHAKAAKEGTASWSKLVKIAEDAMTHLEPKEKEEKLKNLRKQLKPMLDIEEKIDAAMDAIKDIATLNTSLMHEAQQMLRDWEAGEPETIVLWKKMNSWVYDGFAVTYRKLGVRFDKTYYESETYLLGKKLVEDGLNRGVLQKRPDGAVILDLTVDKLDPKVLLRSDGTSVYMTQDLGTAVERYNEYHFSKHIYVVGNEQDHHFKVLKIALKRLGYDWAEGLYHLSYGMVELPEGKMKSREGTVVDADDLVDEVESAAGAMAQERGLLEGMSEEEKRRLYHTVGTGALKYFILKVDPKKTMLFNPSESVKLEGDTGPFIQYAYARSRQLKNKVGGEGAISEGTYALQLHAKDKALLKLIYNFPNEVHEAAKAYSPALIAMYSYELARLYNSWFNDDEITRVKDETDPVMKDFRLLLSNITGRTLKTAMGLLGIEVPEKM